MDLKADYSNQSQGYQGLKEQLEQMWKVKFKVVLMVIGALDTVTPKLEEFLQQISGPTSEVAVQKTAAKILHRTLRPPQTFNRGPEGHTHLIYLEGG